MVLASDVIFDQGAAWALAGAGLLLALVSLAATVAVWRMGTANRKLLAALERGGTTGTTAIAPLPSEPERSVAEAGPAEPRPDVVTATAPPERAREEEVAPREPVVAQEPPRPEPPKPEDEFRRLLGALRAPDPFVRVEAIASLRGRPQAEGDLIRALDDEFPMVRREAVRSIRYATPSRARQALVDVVAHDPSPEVREEAVAALASLLQEQASAGNGS